MNNLSFLIYFFSGPGIGYMPQELALQSDLTIGEMLAFYGRLCLLDEKTIASQTDYLVGLLELPHKDRFISSLSGGQKRRVSLAVTIIHKPRLAVLGKRHTLFVQMRILIHFVF